MTAFLGFPYPQERICNLKISVDHSPFAFGSEPAFKLARHRITLLICKSRCHVKVSRTSYGGHTADNELLARRARRKGRAEHEVQERRSSGGPWRSGCVRARRGVRRCPRGRMAGADRAMPMRAAAPAKRERKGQTANAVLCARAPCTGRPVPRPRRGGAVSVRAAAPRASAQLARQNIPMFSESQMHRL